jgi:hypothetical protein
MNGMEPDDLLCSHNARPRKALARANGTSWEIACVASGGRAGEKYLPVGGWVRKSCTVEDQSSDFKTSFSALLVTVDSG